MATYHSCLLVFLLAFIARGDSFALNEGQLKQLQQKNEARHRRIDELRQLHANSDITDNERKEFIGLSSLGDPYDPVLFTDELKLFKTAHNQAFAVLARHAQKNSIDHCPVFYLDGSDGGTTSTLLEEGFDRDELYVANNWEGTVGSLRSKPHSLKNCFLGKAQDVLRRPDIAQVPFAAVYFDGCGGMVQPMIDMIEALFEGTLPNERFAIGFTLTDAEPEGVDILDRLQTITRGIMKETKQKGYAMHYVGDDPERFGLGKMKELARKHGSTCTTWISIELP